MDFREDRCIVYSTLRDVASKIWTYDLEGHKATILLFHQGLPSNTSQA